VQAPPASGVEADGLVKLAVNLNRLVRRRLARRV